MWWVIPHKIEYVDGHWEVKDECGNFVLSGDTCEECYNDLVDMLVAEAKIEIHMENIGEKVSAWANTKIDTRDHINTEANL